MADHHDQGAHAEVHIRRLAVADLPLMRDLNRLFGAAFEDEASYHEAPPSDGWLAERLGSRDFIALAAVQGDTVVGGIAGYVLRKFERERKEVYLYDLAVAEPFRRQGIATALIRALQQLAAELGAYVIFVQADPPDAAAVALYEGLGTREEVYHYDIGVAAPDDRDR